MTDIVERLRDPALVAYRDGLGELRLLAEAADEIERLRASANTRGEREKVLRAEIERLKHDIMELTCGDPGHVSGETSSWRVNAFANELFRQAGYSAPMTRWQQEEYQSRAKALITALAEDGPPTKEGFGTGSQPLAAPHPSPTSSEDTTK